AAWRRQLGPDGRELEIDAVHGGGARRPQRRSELRVEKYRRAAIPDARLVDEIGHEVRAHPAAERDALRLLTAGHGESGEGRVAVVQRVRKGVGFLVVQGAAEAVLFGEVHVDARRGQMVVRLDMV